MKLPPPSPIYLSLVVEGFVCINKMGRISGGLVGGHPPGSITYVYVIDEGSFLVFNIYIIYFIININIYVENMKTKVGSEGGRGTFQLFYINIKRRASLAGARYAIKRGLAS